MIKDDKGNVYSRGGFPYSVWKRYLKHFNQITVLGRERERIHHKSKLISSSLSVSSGPGVDFVSIPNLSSIKGKLVNQKNAKIIIENELKKADALIARLPSEIGKLAIKVAKENNVPYLIELVGCPYDALRFVGNYKGKVYAPINMLQTKRMIKNSGYTIYVTKDYLQKRYPTNGQQVNISNVEIGNNEDGIISRRVNKIENITKRKLRIGMIGTLNSKYKGFDLAIKYLSKIKPNSDDYEIHILGGGDASNFNSVISDSNMKPKVYFDGTRASGTDVFKWLDDIDLYIQPSLTEGLPRALIEALSRGCLAIGSLRGGIPELLGGKLLFNPLSFDSFKNAVNNALSSKKYREEQVIMNVNIAQDYSSKYLTEKRNKFINDFIKEKVLVKRNEGD